MQTEQYRNFDAPRRPQAVTIEWECLTPYDDCADRPDERQDGFWPSTKPDDPGYVGAENVANFLALHEAAKERMAAWKRDDWGYVGVIARARIAVPIGGGSFCTYTLESPGLWGVESDSPEYIAEVFEEQKAELLAHLTIMGQFFAATDAKELH